jgi:hypothetical protein
MPNAKSAAPHRSEDFLFKDAGEDPDYDSWFREQVKIALQAVARGETVEHEAVRARWSKKRAELLRRANQA